MKKSSKIREAATGCDSRVGLDISKKIILAMAVLPC
jgi:hypothetical protein